MALAASEPFESLEPRLAFGIDLAAVIGLALVGIPDDLLQKGGGKVVKAA